MGELKPMMYGIGECREKFLVDGFCKVKYGKEAEREKTIEINIIRRKHKPGDYLSTDFKKFNDEKNTFYHYYIFYAKVPEGSEPGKLKELNEEESKGFEFDGENNCVNSTVCPGQKIKWICLYPFTIYYGGTSIITTDKHGWPRPRQIIPYLKAHKIEFKSFDPNSYENNYYYETQDAYIVNNVLSGSYKSFVSVYIPDDGNGGGDIICVDDPQDDFPPPDRG